MRMTRKVKVIVRMMTRSMRTRELGKTTNSKRGSSLIGVRSAHWMGMEQKHNLDGEFQRSSSANSWIGWMDGWMDERLG